MVEFTVTGYNHQLTLPFVITMSEKHFCSQSSGQIPMAGTADPTDVWLLLEYSPSWEAKALEDSSLSVLTRQWLDAAILAVQGAGLKVRAQLVRQPELKLDRTRLLVCYRERLVEFSGANYDFLQSLDIIQVLEDPSVGKALGGSHYFVCTNGKRDVCCARFGRPIYGALREESTDGVGENVWQINHVGGHRYAPNVLVLPQGVLYGRLTVDSVQKFVGTTGKGDLAFEYLRGRSHYPTQVQAAEAFVQVNGLQFEQSTGDSEHATIVFSDPNSDDCSDEDSVQQEPLISINVRRTTSALAAFASCTDGQQKPVRPYEQTDVRAIDKTKH